MQTDMQKDPFKPFRFFGKKIFFKKDQGVEDPDPWTERMHQSISGYIPAFPFQNQGYPKD
jgi:hypothetical protein